MTTNRKAEIICVGTELLLGQIVNTNAAWLARELSLLGIHSYYQTVVGDNPGRLADCIRQAIGRSDIILLTGGLGPTQDDITMAVASSVAGLPLKLHEPSRAAIADYFQRIGRSQVTSNNWKQAMLPDPGIVMPNSNGTAPGAILETRQGDRTVHLVLLPGPPSEMTVMFRDQAAPWLQAQTTARLRHVFVRMIGIGESAAEAALSDLIERQSPTLAPYASEGEVVFRITQAVASDDEPDTTQVMLDEVKRRVGQHIYEVGMRTMPEVVRDLLINKNQTVSYAESCTGGLATGQLTDSPAHPACLRAAWSPTPTGSSRNCSTSRGIA
jgi:nicotinamide-nucleotide amidase